jgi:hypothetical protein
MAFHVVDAHEVCPGAEGERLGVADANEQGADESRGVGDGDDVDRA